MRISGITTLLKRAFLLLCIAGYGHTSSGESGWRVIPGDPAFPTDDVIVSYCSVTDSPYNLPGDPANTDCTTAFQAALDAASAAGGGTVFVPAGEYRFDGNLNIGNNVTLRGRWVEPSSTQPVTGTILKIFHNRNNGSAAPFLSLNRASGVRDLAFWHPEQSPDNIVPYPFVLDTTGNVGTVENVTLVNAYQGMDFSKGSFLNMRNAYGSPLYRGYMVDRAYAVPRMQGAHFSPDYWAWSGLPGAPEAGGAHAAFMKSNGIGILVRELDAGHVTFSRISGYKVGLQYERSPTTGDNAGEQSIMGNVIENCTDALLVDSVKSLKILQCTFSGTDYGVRHLEDGDLIFTDCTISGGIDAVHDEVVPGETNHEFNFQGCRFDGPVRVRNRGSLNMVDCEFLDAGLDIELASGVDGAIIAGCSFADGPDISDNSGASAEAIKIDHGPVTSYSTPPFPEVYDKVRKPDKLTFFNVLDYGATGDGFTDDTDAVQDTLQAAQDNGGGIVFFPAGIYKMTDNLDVGNGIELRGVHGARHTPDDLTLGSVITINHGKGADSGTAFITLGDRSGLRGLTLHYPEQSYLTPIKYPFMIRCQGVKNYLIDNAGTNAYQAVDLDNADEHLVEYSFFGAWKKAYQIGGGSENGRIQNLHVKWDFWRDSRLDGAPVGSTEHDRGEVTCGKNLDTFTLNNCSGQTLFAIFNHACHTFVTQNGGTGAAYGIGVEENQRGYVFNKAPVSGTFDFVLCAVNIHNQGDWSGKYAFRVNSTYDGDVVFHNTFMRGNPEYIIRSDSGTIIFQQGDFSSGGSRGIYTLKAAGNVVLDNLAYSTPFDLEVPARGSFAATHIHFNGGYGNMPVNGEVYHALNTYAGSFIAADVNQDPVRDRGIVMDTANMEPAIVDTLASTGSSRSPPDYVSQFQGWRLKTGSSVHFEVTDPEFHNGNAGNVRVELRFLDDTDGTLNVYYKSTSGEKLGGSYTMSANSNPVWANRSFSASDTAFDGSMQDIRIEVLSGDPVFSQVMVEANSFLGLPESDLGEMAPMRIEAEDFFSANGVLRDFIPGDESTLQIKSIDEGDWAEYTVRIPVTGQYLVRFRVASDLSSPAAAGSVNLSVDDIPLGSVEVYGTDGLENWTTIASPATFAAAGGQTLYLNFQQGDFVLNWFELVMIDQYGLWEEAFGGMEAIGSPTQDHDGDGLANLVEYAFNGDPGDASNTGASPKFSYEGGFLHYLYPVRALDPGILHTLEMTSDLASGIWTPAVHVSSELIPGDPVLDYRRTTFHLYNEPTFMRLIIRR